MKNVNTKMVQAICPNCGVGLTCSAMEPATKCHWCHTLIPASLYVENPNMPEQILPFKVAKEEAKRNINKYLSERKIYTDKNFKREFNIDDITPVYLPYMLVDINLHSENKGVIANYKLEDCGSHKEFVYRDFDMYIENALIEASKSNYFNNVNSTSNVISSVVPFDIENAVEFNTNYLNGYSSENRELNLDLLKPKVNEIAENNTNKFLSDEISDYHNKLGQYNYKTNWFQKKNTIIGTQWSSIFLPVWIYSYCEKQNDLNKIYYIAVNGRTGKTVGSIPLNRRKLLNIRIILNIIFFLIIGIVPVLYIKYLIHRFSIGYSDEIDWAIPFSMLMAFLIPAIYLLRKYVITKIITKIENKYIYIKQMNNILNTNVVVYDWNYSEYHNKKSEMGRLYE